MILARLSLILALVAYGSSNSMSGTFQTLRLECTSKPEEENKESGKNYDSEIEKLQSRLNKLERESNAIKEPEITKPEEVNSETVKKLQSRIDELELESNAIKKLRPQNCSQIKDLNPGATTGRYVVYDNIFDGGKHVNCNMSAGGVEMLSKNCKEILDNNPSSINTDGVYTIQINPSTIIDVYCEMTQGGWTVFQKRFDGSEDFRRNFNEYSEGFGDPSQEHWLGLNNVHQLTSQPGYNSWILRVDLESFEGETRYAQYENFNIGAGKDYILSFGGYSGTAGDALTHSKGSPFSTYDRDVDKISGNCAISRNSAWWFRSCSWSNLNAYMYNDNRPWKGMFWYQWKDSASIPLKATVMKMKPML